MARRIRTTIVWVLTVFLALALTGAVVGAAAVQQITYSDGGVLYTILPDGTGKAKILRLLTNPSAAFPKPDGSKVVAHVSGRPWLADPDGNNAVNISSGTIASYNSAYAWEPTGARIAFAGKTSATTGFTTIWVMNDDGSGVTPVTTAGTSNQTVLDWGGSGPYILYRNHDSGNQTFPIWRTVPGGGNGSPLTPLSYSVTYAKYSPDGSKIAFIGYNKPTGTKNGIYVMNADGSGITRLTTTPALQPTSVDWKTDGSTTLYNTLVVTGREDNTSNPWAVWTVSDAGGPATVVVSSDTATGTVNTALWGLLEPLNQPPTAGNVSGSTNEDASVSVTLTATDPDGQALTFAIVAPPTNGTLGAIGAPTCVGLTCTATVVYTPNGDYFGSDSFTYKANDSLIDSNTATVSLTVNARNDAPSFVGGGNQAVLEDAGAQTVAAWATSISKGPANESGQTLTFLVTNDNNALFSVQPSISAATGALSYTPAANANGTATVTVRLQDNGGTANGGQDTSAAQTFTIAVTSVNDAPSFTKGANQGIDENAPAQSVAGWATAISPGPADESGQTLNFIVTNDNNALFSVQPAISPTTGTLTYTPLADVNGVANVTVRLQDNGGVANGGADTSAVQTFTITIQAINDAPSFTGGANQTVNEDAGAQTVGGWATGMSPGPANESGQTLTFLVTNDNASLFSVAPSINATTGTLTYTPAANAFGTATVTVRLQDNGGTANGGQDTSAAQTFTITVNSVNDVPQFTAGANQTVLEDAGPRTLAGWATGISSGPVNEGAQTLTFTVTNNNNALFSVQPAVSSGGTLTFTPAADANGTATVTVVLSDNGGVANGGVDTTVAQTFTITVTAVNDVPSFTKGADESVLENTGAHSVPGWATAISPGPADEAGQTLTFLVTTDNPGLFSVAPAINATTGTLTYTLAANVSGVANVSVRLQDNGGTANGGQDTSPIQTMKITVLGVNDAPSFTPGSNQTVLEDAAAQTVNGWATAISPGPADEAGQTVTFVVTNDNNSLFSVQPAISSTGTLTYTPAANANGVATVTVYLQDNGGTANGGDDTSNSVTFTITVTAVNDVPSFTKGANENVYENTGAHTVPGWATLISPGPANEAGQTLTFLVTNSNNALFSVQPAVNATTGDLTYTLAANANGVATVTVRIQDNGGVANGGVDTSSAQTFTITVTGINDEPSFTKGANQTVLEDAGPQTVASWATAISAGPPDESGQTLTFTVTNNNNSLFSAQPAISSTGTLTYTPAPNANGTATVTVVLKDDGGTALGGDDTSPAQTFTITVTGVNDEPSFTKGANQTPLEDSGAQSAPGWATLISKGPSDESGQTLTFTVTNDNNSLFTVQPSIDVATGTLTYTLAANANGTANVSVVLQDDGGVLDGGDDTYATQTFTITVAAVNDEPSFVPGASPTVLEDAGAQSVAGWATAISKGPANESGQTLTFTVTNTNNSLFSAQPAINATTGTLTYTPAANANGTATVSVVLKDDGGTLNGGDDTFATQTFTITVTAVNDAPTFTGGGNQTVDENAPAQTVANWATGMSAGPSDESGQALTFQVTNDNNSLFSVQPSINPATGALTYTPAAGANGVAIVTVVLKDDGGTLNGGSDTSAAQTFTISIKAINDAPSFTKGANESVLEDSGAHSVPGWATAISPGPANESGQTVWFNVSNNNNGLFTVQPAISSTGTLTYTLAPDAFGVATVTVTVQDDGGTADGGVDTSPAQTFTITVTNVNDEPSFTKGADQMVLEDAAAQSVVNWATALSKGPANESGQTLTFVVTNNNNGLFSTQPAVSSAGTLTYALAANANGTATVTVTLTDNGGTANGGDDTSPSQTFTITVTAVNDAPSFTKGANQTKLEDTPGVQTAVGWATALSRGPADEAGQTLTFTVTNDNNALFSAQPAISSAGDLTYTLAPNVYGVATVSVTLSDNGGTANGGADTSAVQTFTITVTTVNDEPSFTKGADVTVLEDAAAQTLPGWATAISPGPADESGQSLTFTVTNSNNSLFMVQPAISSAGTLTFRPAANANGTATVDVVLKDNGGTLNGGDDTSITQTFTITVTAVNDEPSFIKGADQTVLENTGLHSVPGWATSLSKGPADESSQTLSFTVTNDNNALFSVQPAINSAGDLTYTLAAGQNGTANVTVVLKDDGGVANGGDDTSPSQSFVINVTTVNDAPSFTKGPDKTVLEDAGAQSFVNWATAISKGPADENWQTLTFTVTTNNNSLFSVLPAINATTGTLTFTPAPNANGTATVTVVLSDNGGTADGGDDTADPQTFVITVTAVNDEPSFTPGPNQTPLEDATAVTVAPWATAISKGPADESGQTLTFTVTNNNNSLFSVQPVIDSAGTLTYTLAPNAIGSATVSVTLSDNGGTLDGGDDTAPTITFTITVTAVNDEPTFTKGADVTVLEDSGPKSVTGWATAISKGPADESGQTLTFTVTNNANSLFSAQPAIDASGNLTFTPAADAYGTATVTVVLKDNGGVANGGDDTSATETFLITITPVNDAPSFTGGGNRTVAEDAGAQSIANWATLISKGAANESGQTLTFWVSNTNTALFSAQPAISAAGTLTFTPANDAVGTATVSVYLQDDGGTLDGGADTSATQTFTITVTPVNDTPSFTAGPNQSVLEDAGAQSVANWATAIWKGPADESAQTVTFLVSNNNNALFSVQPAVSSTGTLTYTPAANAYGTATVTVRIQDSGGGADTSAPQTFTITVTSVNDPPTAVNDTATVINGSGSVTVNVLANDSFAPDTGETLTVQSVSVPGNGTASVTGGGTTVSYTPNAGYYGADSFTYTISDGNGGTATATVTVTVTGQTLLTIQSTTVQYTDKPTVSALLTLNGTPVTGKIVTFSIGGGNTCTANTDTAGVYQCTINVVNTFAAGPAWTLTATYTSVDPYLTGDTDTQPLNSVQETGTITGTWRQAGASSNYKVQGTFTEANDGSGNTVARSITFVYEVRPNSSSSWTTCATSTVTLPAGSPATIADTEQNCGNAGSGYLFQVSIQANSYYTANTVSGSFSGGTGGSGTFSVVSPTGTSGSTTTLSAGFGGATALRDQPVLLAAMSSDAAVPMQTLQKSLVAAAATTGGKGKPSFPTGLIGHPIAFYIDGEFVGEAPIGEDGNAYLPYKIEKPAGQYLVQAIFRGTSIHAPASGTGVLTVFP